MNSVKICYPRIRLHWKNRISELATILKNDNLEKFKQLNHKNILQYFSGYCATSASYNCKCITPLACIISNNKANIADYMIDTYGLNISELLFMCNKWLKTNKSDMLTKKVNDILIKKIKENKFNQNEINAIINCLIHTKSFSIIKNIHELEFRCADTNLLQIVNIDDIDVYINKGYKMTNDIYLKRLTVCNLDFIKKFSNFHTVFSDDNNTKYINNILSSKKYTKDAIEFIIEKGFKLNDKLLHLACKYGQLDLIDIMQTYGYILSKNNLCELLELSQYTYTPEVWRPRYRRRFIRRKLPKLVHPKNFDIYDSDAKKLQLLNIIKTYVLMMNNNTPSLQEILKYDIRKLLDRKLWAILDYCKNELHITIKYKIVNNRKSSFNYETLVEQYITQNDVYSIKKLFEYTNMEPILISQNSNNMDKALFFNASKVVKYFLDELNMRASLDIYTQFERYMRLLQSVSKINHQTRRWSSWFGCYRYTPTDIIGILYLINLDSIGYPYDENEIIKLVCRYGDIDTLEYLIYSKNIDVSKFPLPQKLLINSIARRQYDMADYLINAGIPLEKELFINKVITHIVRPQKGFRGRHMGYRTINNKKINVNLIKYLHIKGCTLNDSVMPYIMNSRVSDIDVPIYIHKFIGIKPSIPNILTYFASNRSYMDYSHDAIKLFSYIENNIYTNIYDRISAEISEYILKWINRSMYTLVIFFTKKINYKFTQQDMSDALNARSTNIDIDYIQYLENNGLTITLDDFKSLISISSHYIDIIKYIMDKYHYTATLKEVHEALAHRFSDDFNDVVAICKVLNITPTPYTIDIMVSVSEYYHIEHILKIIDNINCGIMKVTHDKILNIINNNQDRLKFSHKQIHFNIVEYVPLEHEIIQYNNNRHLNNVNNVDEEDEDIEELINGPRNNKNIHNGLEGLDIDMDIDMDIDIDFNQDMRDLVVDD